MQGLSQFANNWWPRIVAAITLLLGLFAGWRGWQAWRADKLKTAQTEIKTLRADVARLLREATVRIDNEQQYIEEIDTLQRKVTQQREQLNEWIGDKQNSQSPNR